MSLASISSLAAYLKSGKDMNKDCRNLTKLLNEVVADSARAGWAKQVALSVLDPLLLDALPAIKGTAVAERECIAAIHRVCAKSLLPVTGAMEDTRPMFLFTAAEVPEADFVSPQADRWFDILVNHEVNNHVVDNLRRTLAIETLGCLAEAGQLSSEEKIQLGNLCREQLLSDSVLGRVSAPIQIPEKPTNLLLRPLKRGSAAHQATFASKDEEKILTNLCEVCIICATKCLPESGPMLHEDIANALCAVRGNVCRLAMAFLAKACLFDVESVFRELSIRLPAAPGTIELTDELATQNFARICLMLTSEPSHKTFQALALLVRDERPRVFLLACELLSKVPWQWLQTFSLPTPPEDNNDKRPRHSASGIKLVPEMIYRLTEALSSDKDTILAATCHTIAALARAQCIWVSKDWSGRSSTDDPFLPLSSRVAALCIDSPNSSLRSAAALALCWVGKPSTLPEKLRTIGGDNSKLVEALIERMDNAPSHDLSSSLLRVVWLVKEGLSSHVAIKAIGICFQGAAREAAPQKRARQERLIIRCLLSLLDYSSDVEDAPLVSGLLGIISSEALPLSLTTPPRIARSIILRLERSLRLSYELGVRYEAARGLVRLAILCGEPTRIHVYEILRDVFIFSQTAIFASDYIIRDEIIGPALTMFDEVYSLFLDKVQDITRYASADKHALQFCPHLPSNFSFLAQAKEVLKFVGSEDDIEEEDDESEVESEESQEYQAEKDEPSDNDADTAHEFSF